MCEEAEELEMPTERYIQDLQQALTGAEDSTNYSFSLTPSPPDVSSAVTLAYEKVQRDISVSISAAITRISDVWAWLCLFILSVCLPVRSAGNANIRLLVPPFNQFQTQMHKACLERRMNGVWKTFQRLNVPVHVYNVINVYI